MPATAYASHTATAVATAVSDVVAPKPSGTVSGSRLVAFCWANNTSTDWNAPDANWVSRNNKTTIGCEVFEFTAGGSEPATYTFSRTVSSSGAGGVILVRLTDAGTFTDAEVINGGSVTSITLPDSTVVTNGSYTLEIVSHVTTTATTWTEPASATMRASGNASGNAIPYAIGDEFDDTPSTGTKVWTKTGSQQSRGVILVFEPIPVAPSYTNTINLPINDLVAAMAGTHTAPTYTNSVALTIKDLVAAGSSGYTNPVYTNTVAFTVKDLVESMSGGYTAPGYSNAIALVVKDLVAAGNSGYTNPVYTNALALSVNDMVASMNSNYAPAGTYSNSIVIVIKNLVESLVGSHPAPVGATMGLSIADIARATLLTMVGGDGVGKTNVDLFREAVGLGTVTDTGKSFGTMYEEFI